MLKLIWEKKLEKALISQQHVGLTFNDIQGAILCKDIYYPDINNRFSSALPTR